MYNTESFFSFLGFFSCFLAALTTRFIAMVSTARDSATFDLLQTLFVLLAAFFLGLTFKYLRLLSKNSGRSFLLGFLSAIPLFLITQKIETGLSHDLLLRQSDPTYFSSLNGHCGVYSGRALVRLYDLNFRSPIQGAIRNYQLGSRCRLSHLEYLKKEGRLRCADGETEIDCRVRWMNAFSEKGFWDYETRHHFFEDVMALFEKTRATESLINYVLKDQELDVARQTLLKQAGIEDSLSLQPMLMQQKDELRHLELTFQILERVDEVTKELKGTPSPQLLKYRDFSAETHEKKSKLSDLKQAIERLESKIPR